MKIELNAEERKYLYNLLRIIALQTKDVPQSAGFWLGLANKLGPNQEVVYLRRYQAEQILTVTKKAITTITSSDTLNKGDAASDRAALLKVVLDRALSKIEAKLKASEEEDKDGKGRNDQVSEHHQEQEL